MHNYKVIYLFTLVSFEIFCQIHTLEVIGSCGGNSTTSLGSIAWTIGEVSIETYQTNHVLFTQGFHQPNKRSIIKRVEVEIPEGFSPNNDQINDLFVIRGIENYPNNHIRIYNRWGVLIYEMHAYVNQWDGKTTKSNTLNSSELPTPSYFYLLDLGNETPIKKGSIYLTR
jgi:gliding motility-associated-like protein